VRIVVNGQSGKVHGNAPLSWWKVTIACVVLVAIAAGIFWLWWSAR
jgi:hypothetical protein